MKYEVQLKKTDEGYAVRCPGLPGCWSQGKAEEEALENIKDAIKTYLETIEELNKGKNVRVVEVPARRSIDAFTMGVSYVARGCQSKNSKSSCNFESSPEFVYELHQKVGKQWL